MITLTMAKRAISRTLPFARTRCAKHKDEAPGVVFAVWALGWVIPYVYGMDELGPIDKLVERWNWDFRAIALEKLRQSREFGVPSDVIVGERSWLIMRGEGIFGGSYCVDKFFVVAVSGSKEEVDLDIAKAAFTEMVEMSDLMVNEARGKNKTTL